MLLTTITRITADLCVLESSTEELNNSDDDESCAEKEQSEQAKKQNSLSILRVRRSDSRDIDRPGNRLCVPKSDDGAQNHCSTKYDDEDRLSGRARHHGFKSYDAVATTAPSGRSALAEFHPRQVLGKLTDAHLRDASCPPSLPSAG